MALASGTMVLPSASMGPQLHASTAARAQRKQTAGSQRAGVVSIGSRRCSLHGEQVRGACARCSQSGRWRRRKNDVQEAGRCGNSALYVSCASGLQHPGEEREASGDQFPLSMAIPTTAMAKKSRGGGGLGLKEKQKFVVATPTKERPVAPKLDDSSGGGNNGKNIFNGGGGDGGEGDDDDYFDDFDGDGDGEEGGKGFFRKRTLEELRDPAAIAAVLQEWFRSMADLPGVVRHAINLKTLSSAQLVRFLSTDVRPNIARAVTRHTPSTVSRGIIGRLMADPAFLQKVGVEMSLSAAFSLWHEAQHRGESFRKELDLAAINTLVTAAATGAVVYMLTPSRAARVNQMPWQRLVANLPNNLFEASVPLREYNLNMRLASFFSKAAELSAVGAAAGGTQWLLNQAALAAHKAKDPNFTPSVAPTGFSQSLLGSVGYLALASNARYQTIAGVDRFFFERAEALYSYCAASALLRIGTQGLLEPLRSLSLGRPLYPPQQQQSSPALSQPVVASNAVPIRRKRVVRKKRAPGTERGFEMSGTVGRAAAA